MASPQKENGYTPVANELLEAIYAFNFNATQLKILLFIMRYTYGYSRKEHQLSLTFIAAGTGISKRYISSELKKLLEKKVLLVTEPYTDTTARTLKVNKNYEMWGQSSTSPPQGHNPSTGEELFPPPGEEAFPSPGEELFPQEKQKLKQKIKQKEDAHAPLKLPQEPVRDPPQKEAEALFQSIWRLYPVKKGKGQVSAAKKRELYRHGYEVMARCIARYRRDKEDWRQWQNGSTFFNTGYIDYLDENYTQGGPFSEQDPAGKYRPFVIV